MTVLGWHISGELHTVSLYQKKNYCLKVQLGAQKSVTVRGELLTVLLKPVSL